MTLFLALVAVVMTGLLWGLEHYWNFKLPEASIWWIVVAQGVLALVCEFSRRYFRPHEGLLFLLLIGSLCLMGIFLFASGGHTNPLISLLLLPLAVSAAMLHWIATLILSVSALVAYSWLTAHFLPLGSDDPVSHRQVMRMHFLGMWVTFGASVLVILSMIVPMAASLRRQRDFIARQREIMLRDERLVAMATFAASAAHQLGTPLATLTLLADDIRDACQDRQDLSEDVAQMHRQIALCKDTLGGMMRRADSIRLGLSSVQNVEALLQRLREQFTLLHPERSPVIARPLPGDALIRCDETLEQALLNLLDNAAKACSTAPRLSATVQPDHILIRITDDGPGLPTQIQARFGEPFLPSEAGMGLGLFLSNATIQRLGGALSIRTDTQGNHAEIRLPRLGANA